MVDVLLAYRNAIARGFGILAGLVVFFCAEDLLHITVYISLALALIVYLALTAVSGLYLGTLAHRAQSRPPH